MATLKPVNREVREALKLRGVEQQTGRNRHTQTGAGIALRDGALSVESLQAMIQWNGPAMTVMDRWLEALAFAPGTLPAESEKVALKILAEWYLADGSNGTPDAAFDVASKFLEWIFTVEADADRLLFDQVHDSLNQKPLLVAVTGTFTGVPRAEIYSMMRARNCVPCYADWRADALVITDDALLKRRFTSTVTDALWARHCFGRPLIVREAELIRLLTAQ